jgi:hypothetical protein
MAENIDTRPEGATNDRPKRETIAQTGEGLPDEALGPGESPPDALKADPELEKRMRRNLAVQGEGPGEDKD